MSPSHLSLWSETWLRNSANTILAVRVCRQTQTAQAQKIVHHSARFAVLRGFVEQSFAVDPQGLESFLQRACGPEEEAVVEHCSLHSYLLDSMCKTIRRL
eukprot:TRINITY_DN13760_c0_g1_i1.p1 TRINITY_DN13760_c0_g1~~TRINITY_DN13760_c0_g1_i1.p1  ORF type:complete len:100 (-),score=5.59 TRINITY_DN13760_c0_g1_i1:203-502(-)